MLKGYSSNSLSEHLASKVLLLGHLKGILYDYLFGIYQLPIFSMIFLLPRYFWDVITTIYSRRQSQSHEDFSCLLCLLYMSRHMIEYRVTSLEAVVTTVNWE